jgi:hypothetical protein
MFRYGSIGVRRLLMMELDALGLGQNCYETKYNGSWSQTATIRTFCGLLFDGDDDGVGGAKYRPRMRRAG